MTTKMAEEQPTETVTELEEEKTTHTDVTDDTPSDSGAVDTAIVPTDAPDDGLSDAHSEKEAIGGDSIPDASAPEGAPADPSPTEESTVALEEGSVAVEEGSVAVEEGSVAVEEGSVALEDGAVVEKEDPPSAEQGAVEAGDSEEPAPVQNEGDTDLPLREDGEAPAEETAESIDTKPTEGDGQEPTEGEEQLKAEAEEAEGQVTQEEPEGEGDESQAAKKESIAETPSEVSKAPDLAVDIELKPMDEESTIKEYKDDGLNSIDEEVSGLNSASIPPVNATSDAEESEEELPEIDREQLIEQYHKALADRERQIQVNYQLQHKLGEHFRKKRSEETRQEVDKNSADSEQRYIKYMSQLDDLQSQDTQERDTYKMHIEEMKDKCQIKQGLVEEEQCKFMEFQKQIALNSLNSRSGKPIAAKDIDQYLAVETRKEAEVIHVRLENIKLKNKLKKKEQQLKSKEELAEGLHLIDFEQLKIENQTYNEKIEERNEDLLKLRKKITSTVQVLTHLKEKLQFVHAENQVLKAKLHEVEGVAAKKRDILTRTKQARDHLRIDNHKLRQNCGLLGNEPLLRDFEEQQDESTELRDKIEQLKTLHSDITLSCNSVRKKIEQVRNGRA